MGNLSITEYEAHLCELSRRAMNVMSDEVERVHLLVRGLTFCVKSYVFRETREGPSF